MGEFRETVTQVSEHHGGWLQPHREGTDFLVCFRLSDGPEGHAARRAVRAALVGLLRAAVGFALAASRRAMVSHGAELVGNVPVGERLPALAKPGWW